MNPEIPESVEAAAPGVDANNEWLQTNLLKMQQEAIEAQANELRLGRMLIPYLEAELEQRRHEIEALRKQLEAARAEPAADETQG